MYICLEACLDLSVFACCLLETVTLLPDTENQSFLDLVSSFRFETLLSV
jgi:hypothetical protein